MSLPVVRKHTDAVIAALVAEGVTVGDCTAPDAAPPYVIVYPIAGGSTTGTLAAPDEDAVFVYQVTCVGVSRRQAEWLEDRALHLLTTTFWVPGRKIVRVSLDMHGGVQCDNQVTPPVFWSVPRFRIISTPA